MTFSDIDSIIGKFICQFSILVNIFDMDNATASRQDSSSYGISDGGGRHQTGSKAATLNELIPVVLQFENVRKTCKTVISPAKKLSTRRGS